MKYIYRIIYTCLAISLTSLLSAQTMTENFTRTYDCLDSLCTKSKETVFYFDGLGREKQTLQVAGSTTGKTIVTHYEYDKFGRQAKEFLPYTISSGSRQLNSQNNGNQFYFNLVGDSIAYSEKIFENSPLNRILFQAAPGESWKKGNGHEIGFSYETNTASDAIQKFGVTLSATFIPTLNLNGTYDAGALYRTVTTDENGQPIQEFKDKEGRIILKRIEIPKKEGIPLNSSGSHDTYYVYDIYGNLTYVLPPKLIEVGNYTNNLAELGYQYQYDNKNRLVEKQLPGKGREFMVYDNQNRLTLLQDANQRDSLDKGWTFFKYDKYGRVVYSGFFKNNTIRSSIQSVLDNKKIANNEQRATIAYLNNGANIYYTNSQFPNESLTVQIINYYDDYDNLDILPLSIDGQKVIGKTDTRTKGLIVATLTNVLGTATWNKSYTFYDDKYIRPIATKSINYLGGYTNSASILDFRGKVLNTITKHKLDNASSSEIIVREGFDYYDNELLKSQTHQINDNPVEYIAQNSYNEINQLINKKVGTDKHLTNPTPIQSVDYKYNIRGWLTDINDINATETDKFKDIFALRLNYDKKEKSKFKTQYNGNIAETLWKTSSDNKIRSYGYDYDDLNRLLKAEYIKGENEVLNAHNEEIKGYDKNGNILGIIRSGNQDLSSNPAWIDNLVYDYQTNSNKLLSVTDITTEPKGFKDGNLSGNDYAYDLNGNLKKDLNKEITDIKYNDLNLPIEVLWNASKKINYIYDASGTKLRKIVTNGTNISTTDYINGFQYKNGDLEYFPHAEGYVDVAQGGKSFMYYYNHKDHLGNVRLTYFYFGRVTILDENHYYPFGLQHQNYGKKDFEIYSQYKYNGKEWQGKEDLDINLYDYGARNYDPAIGRWFNVDPLAEEFEELSPYNYVLNNPIRMTDSDGMAPDDIIVKINNVSKGGGVVTRSVDVRLTLTVVNSNKSDLSKTMFNKKSGTVRVNEFEGTGQKGYNNNQLVSVDDINSFTIEYKVVNSLEDVGKNDHVLILADELNGKSSVVGRADSDNPGGRITAVETKTIANGSFNTIAKHEIGHNLGLKHTSNGLMKEEPNKNDRKVSLQQKGQIIGGVIGMLDKKGTYQQSTGSRRDSRKEAKEFKKNEIKR